MAVVLDQGSTDNSTTNHSTGRQIAAAREGGKMNNELKIIVCNESVSTSIFTDVVTFGILTILLFINYNCLGDSTLILLLTIACFFTKLFVSANTK
jgi:hypothetical protein